MTPMLFDTHAHYDDEKFEADRNEVILNAHKSGVGLILNAGCDLESSYKSVLLAGLYDFIYCAAGIHPHETEKMRDGDIYKIETLLKKDKVKALGEIGLDYHYDFSKRDIQKKRFAEQMELAESLKMPVIIHDREAHEDCLEIVKRIRVVRGVFHCFSGSAEVAKILISLGYYISFTGSVTFQNARRSHEVLRSLPRERIMIETDCPYLAPEPFRGKRNDSSYLIYTAKKIADIRNESLEDVLEYTYKNGKDFFEIV